jgi:hypothetical protein
MAKNNDKGTAGFAAKFNKIKKSLRKVQRSSDNLAQKTGGLTQATHRHIGLLAAGNLITQQLISTISTTEKLQRDSLAIGLSATKVLTVNSKHIESLSGNLLGFTDAMSIAFAFQATGLDKASKNTFLLGAFTKATGGDVKQLSKDLVKSTAGGRLTHEQMGHLSLTVGSLSQRFKISTNQIAAAMTGLADRMGEFGAIGIGAEMAEGAAKLAAALGPTLKDLGVKSLDFITKGDSLVQANILGVGELRRAVFKGQADPMKLVLKAAESAAKEMDRFLGGDADSTFLVSKFTALFGRGVTDLANLHRAVSTKADGQLSAYTKKLNAEAKMTTEFTQSWTNFRNVVLTPFMKFLSVGFANLQKTFGSEFLVRIGRIAAVAISVTGVLAAVAAAITGAALTLSALITPFILAGGGAAIAGAGVAAGGAAAAATPILLPALGIVAGIAALGGIAVGIKKLAGGSNKDTATSDSASAIAGIQASRLAILVTKSEQSLTVLGDVKIILTDIKELTEAAMGQRQELLKQGVLRPSNAR